MLAISVRLSELVLEARIVVGRQILSSSVKISIFDSISSGTASITRSARLVQVRADLRLRPPQRVRQDVFENGAVSTQGGRVRDPASHRPGADHRNDVDLRHYRTLFSSCWRTSLSPVTADPMYSESRLRSSSVMVPIVEVILRKVALMSST